MGYCPFTKPSKQFALRGPGHLPGLPLFLPPPFPPRPTLTIPLHVGGVGDEVRGRAERNKISWEEKDDVIGQEG